MHIEYNPWEITDDESSHYEHENYRESIFSSSPTPGPLIDSQIYLEIENEDGEDWSNAQKT